MFCPDIEVMGIEQRLAWCCIPVIMALGRLKEVNLGYIKFQANQVYTVSQSISRE